MKLVEFDVQTGAIRRVLPGSDATSRCVYVLCDDSLAERVAAAPAHFFIEHPADSERRCLVETSGGHVVQSRRVASFAGAALTRDAQDSR